MRSTSSATFLVAGTIGAGFDLHQPLGFEETAHPDQGGHRLDRAEDFAVRPANLAPAARHRGEDPGACHVVEAGPHPGESLADDAQALPRLLVDIALAHRRAVIGGRRAAADLDRRTNSDRACIPDDGLPLTAGGEDATWRHGDHPKAYPSNARLALTSQTLSWHSAPLAWGEAPSATRAGQLARNGDAAQPFDLAQHLDQALLPLGAGLGHRDPHLPEAHVQDRPELRVQPSLVTIPTGRQSHHQPVTVGFDGCDSGRAGQQLDPQRIQKVAHGRGWLPKAIRKVALGSLQS